MYRMALDLIPASSKEMRFKILMIKIYHCNKIIMSAYLNLVIILTNNLFNLATASII